MFHRKANKKSLGLLAVLGLVIAGGAAYTVSIQNQTDGSADVAGYGSVTTSGATLVSLAYVTNGPLNPPWVLTVNFTVNIGADVSTVGAAGSAIPNALVGFNDDKSVGTPPTDVALTLCTSTGAPVADSATPADFDASYTCDVSVLDPALFDWRPR